MKISLVAAVAKKNVIGYKGKIPWHIASDLLRFRKITLHHHVIMGRKTFESIGKPLAGRINIVITRNQNYKADGVFVAHSFNEALQIARRNREEEAMVIGGAEIYRHAILVADLIYLTRIERAFNGDAFFPEIDKTWRETVTGLLRVTFQVGSTESVEMKFCLLEKL